MLSLLEDAAVLQQKNTRKEAILIDLRNDQPTDMRHTGITRKIKTASGKKAALEADITKIAEQIADCRK